MPPPTVAEEPAQQVEARRVRVGLPEQVALQPGALVVAVLAVAPAELPAAQMAGRLQANFQRRYATLTATR
jgi:hypothetical protein